MAHWVGELLHIVQFTRFDLAYAIMRLSSYMTCPKIPVFHILHQTMAYLVHHPHMPIMYGRHNNTTTQYHCHFGKGQADILQVSSPTLVSYNDADLAQDLQDR